MKETTKGARLFRQTVGAMLRVAAAVIVVGAVVLIALAHSKSEPSAYPGILRSDSAA